MIGQIKVVKQFAKSQEGIKYLSKLANANKDEKKDDNFINVQKNGSRNFQTSINIEGKNETPHTISSYIQMYKDMQSQALNKDAVSTNIQGDQLKVNFQIQRDNLSTDVNKVSAYATNKTSNYNSLTDLYKPLKD